MLKPPCLMIALGPSQSSCSSVGSLTPEVRHLCSLALSADVRELVMNLAFLVEDPCGIQEIELARALVELARSVPAQHRMTIAGLCRTWTQSFKEGEHADEVRETLDIPSFWISLTQSIDSLAEKCLQRELTRADADTQLSQNFDDHHLELADRRFLRGYFEGRLAAQPWTPTPAQLQELLDASRRAKDGFLIVLARAARWKALAKKLLRRLREERSQRLYEDFEGSVDPSDLVD